MIHVNGFVRFGPRTEPLGTPCNDGNGLDSFPFHWYRFKFWRPIPAKHYTGPLE